MENTCQTHRTLLPPADIYTGPDDTLVTLDMAGVKSDDIRITFHEGVLSVEGTHEDAPCRTTYRRSFTLGEKHDPDAITARASEGVLQVRVGRAVSAKPIVIPVEA